MTNELAIKQESHLIPAAELHLVVRNIFVDLGSEPREAELVADHLVQANLSGHDSHGVGMIPRYHDSLLHGGAFLNRHVRVVLDSGSVLALDGQFGWGQVVASEAMDMGVQRARESGVCLVTLRNAHHIGRVGHWAEQCAAHGMASLHFANVVGTRLVAALGGDSGKFGTNPFCAGLPMGDRPPLIADFATSRIALGKTRVAFNSNKLVPEGCLIDAVGHDTTDPAVMWTEPRGALLPMGEHKGFALAVVAELLGGALSGAGATHPATLNPPGLMNGLFSIIFDPMRLGADDWLLDDAQPFLQWLRTARDGSLDAGVTLPGEPERERRCQRQRDGIPVDATTWTQIQQVAEAAHAARPSP